MKSKKGQFLKLIQSFNGVESIEKYLSLNNKNFSFVKKDFEDYYF